MQHRPIHELIDDALEIVTNAHQEGHSQDALMVAGASLGTFIDYNHPDPFPMQYYYTKLAQIVNAPRPRG